MKILIERVKAENFMSYDELDFQFTEGTSLIIGKNGQGKSATYEAVLWCFEGDTARGISEKKRIEVLKYGKTSGYVSVYGKLFNGKNIFSFTVTRKTGKVKKLETVIDGKAYCTGNLNLDQLTVDKLIGMDKRQFLSATLLGHNSFDFNSVGDSEMKGVLNKYINSEEYLNAQSYASTNLRNIQDEISKLNGEKSGIESSIEKIKEDIAVINKRNVEKNKKELNELRRKEKKLKLRLMDLNYIEEPDYDKLKYNRNMYQSHINELNLAEDKIEELGKLGNECYVCGSKISNETKSKLIEAQMAVAKKAKNNALSVNKEINKIEAIIDLADEKEVVTNDLETVSRQIKMLSSNNAKSDTASAKSVKKLEEQVNEIEARIELYNKRAEIYSFWSKGFGNAGIIGYLVDGIINKLNEKLSQISVELTNGSVIVQYSPYSTSQKGNVREIINKVCFINGEETSYANMSNSERQRTKLLTLFAFREIAEEETGVFVNILYFDEVFEGLDEENTNLVVKYINILKNRSIIVLSHSPMIKYKAKRTYSVINNKLRKV